MAQWIRICLPVQKTRVRSLIREDPTFFRGANPMYHSYRACALEPGNCNHWAGVLQRLKLVCPEVLSGARDATIMRSPCTKTREKSLLIATREKPSQQQRPSRVKIDKLKKKEDSQLHTLPDQSYFIEKSPFLIFQIYQSAQVTPREVWKHSQERDSFLACFAVIQFCFNVSLTYL